MVQPSTSPQLRLSARNKRKVNDENVVSPLQQPVSKQQKTVAKSSVASSTVTTTTTTPSTDYLNLSHIISVLENSTELQKVKNSVETVEDDLECAAQKVLATATQKHQSTGVVNKVASVIEKQTVDGMTMKTTTSSLLATAALEASPVLFSAAVVSAPTDQLAYELVDWDKGLPRKQKDPIPAADNVSTTKPWQNSDFPPPRSRPDALFLFSDITKLAIGWDSDAGTTVGTINNGSWWQTNECFVQQRLTGPNPMKIQSCALDKLKTKLDAMKLSKSDSDGILKSIANNDQLYVLDYSYFLTGYNGSSFPANEYNGIVPATFTIFKAVNNKSLTPLYIILLRSNATPLVAKATDDVADQSWKFAKRCVQCSDFNAHEIGYHLTNTHLAMELIAVASKRILNENGVLFALLDPHFNKTIKVNADARTTLLPYLGQLAGSNVDGIKQLVRNFFEQFSFTSNYPPNELKTRGMLNADGNSILSSYAYATQAVMYWKALIRFFESICVKEYDKKGNNILKDPEIQQWADYIRNKSQGNVRGFPVINSSRVLAEVLSMIVFTCSIQHSAVNYLQRFYFGFVDNAPGAIYIDYNQWKSFNDVTDEAFTVPEKISILQKNLVILLSVPPASVETLLYTVQQYLNEAALKDYVNEINQLQNELNSIGNYITQHDPGYGVLNPISNDTTAATAISI